MNTILDYQEDRKIIRLLYIQNFQEQLCRIFTIENTLQKFSFPIHKR